jgi:hypothetical protein
MTANITAKAGRVPSRPTPYLTGLKAASGRAIKVKAMIATDIPAGNAGSSVAIMACVIGRDYKAVSGAFRPARQVLKAAAPQHVEYQLTALGKTLQEPPAAICTWAAASHAETGERPPSEVQPAR